MIKTILWDFDGVILDSMKLKGDGFVELFKEYDSNQVKKLEMYHYKNGGISRFDKIRYFLNDILEQNIDEDEVKKLADRFGEIIQTKLFDKANLIPETLEFIEKNYQKYDFHIVSGAEHHELNQVCQHFNLEKFFISIHGSPIKKEVLVNNIIHKYHYKIDETILIGDSINDYKAAKENSIKFYGYNNVLLTKFDYINSFRVFEDEIRSNI